MNLWSKLRSLFSRSRLEREMAAEMQAHLDGLTERNIAAGMSPEEARYAARRAFGGGEQIKERARDERGWGWLFDMGRDLRFAFRQLGKERGFAAVAVTTLALGIGASTAIFNITYNVVLDPFPYKDSRGIWAPSIRDVEGQRSFATRYTDYPEVAKLPCVQEAMASGWTTANATGDINAESIRVVFMSDSAWQFLGMPALLGRGIGPSDISSSGDPAQVCVLTYRAWQRLFQGDPDVLGRTLKLNDEVYTIIGVSASRFKWETHDGLFIPLGPNSDARWIPVGPDAGSLWINTNIRLKPGYTPEVARDQLATLYQRLARENPKRFGSGEVSVQLPNVIDISIAQGNFSASLYLLLGAVGFLLLIACTNVANLQLARGSARRRELAIRLSLGAGRGRIARQLLTESVVLALAGGVLGCLLSWGLTNGIMHLVPEQFIPPSAMVRMNGQVLAFAVGVSVLTGILAGLAPVFQCSRANPNEALKEGGSAAGTSRRQRVVGRSLVVFEVMLSVVLLFGATLTIRGFVKLTSVDPGFHSDHTLEFIVPLPAKEFTTPESRHAIAGRLRDSVASLPGVTDVAIGVTPYRAWKTDFTIPGVPSIETRQAAFGVMSANYRAMMGIPLLRGADLEPRDIIGARPVALINETLARLWPQGEDPVGRTMHLSMLMPPGSTPESPSTPDAGIVTVIGIMGDTRNHDLLGKVPPSVFIPYTLFRRGSPGFTVRSRVDPDSLFNVIRAQMREINPNLPLSRSTTAAALLDEQIKQPRFNMTLFTGLAALGLAMACVGIYSVLAYQVAQRTREFGIRMALGAQPGDVLRLVLREGGMLLGIGLLLGAGMVFALARVVTSKVFIVPLLDPAAFVVTVLTLGLTAQLACWLPARRATKVDPMVALRSE